MKEFFGYFFGKGEEVEFVNFTFAHFAPVLVAVAVILAVYFLREKIRSFKYESVIRYAIAMVMICSEMSYYWRLVGVPSLGPNPVDHLPIAVCGWAAILGSYMVVGKSKNLFDMIYFWLFSGSLFALITPTVISYTGPTRFRYYQFWTEHTIGYIGVFYMIFVHGMRPTRFGAWKSAAGLAVLAGVAYFANQMLGPGANYLFMAKPEDTPSVLDILPPNFLLRITIMAAVIGLMYFLAYLPWLLKDKKAKKLVEV